MARRLSGAVGMFKIGKQLFTAEGPRAVRELSKLGAGIFLDLKFHDIPNTVAGAIAAAAELTGVRLVNVHTTGGLQMMRAAAKAVGRGRKRPKVLGVTILTSMDATSMRQVGLSGPPATRVIKLAKLAKKAGLDGVVASAQEAAAIRRACGKNFIILVGGVRPEGTSKGDQARVATPGQAIRAGVNYVVVGRPITGASNPRAAAKAMVDEIAGALRSRR